MVEPGCRWGLPPAAGIKRELRGPRAGGPRGKATWVRGGIGLLASQCDEGLSTGGAARVLPARASAASLCLKGSMLGTSLMVRWRPVRGTRVRSLVWEDATCLGAVRPVCHNY